MKVIQVITTSATTLYPAERCSWEQHAVVNTPQGSPAGSTVVAGVQAQNILFYFGAGTTTSDRLDDASTTTQLGYVGKSGRFVGESIPFVRTT